MIQHLRTAFFTLVAVLAGTSTASAQKVIFPQQQQAGTARSSQQDSAYVLENDLLQAHYAVSNGTLLFDGCDEMALEAGTPLFSISLQDGTQIGSGDMTLESVALTDLTVDETAARGSERLDGKALEARLSGSGMDVTWRAVLRDGSHYLRTELEITAQEDLEMESIIPMSYTVRNEDGHTAPAVVGNTRGAVVASDRLFAGLETPMGINSAGGASTSDFDPENWTESSFSWTPGSDLPAGILALSSNFTTDNIVGAKGLVNIDGAGELTITFEYQSGNHRLNMVGVDLLDASGTVVSQDYHIGYTGNAKSENTYTLQVPEAGSYTVRYFIETYTETIASAGTITWSLPVSISDDIPATTDIEGEWSRCTTLAAGNTWKVSAVVGLIAEGQARRSFLCYSERERAVPWRATPVYISWYELNIDRNNDADYTTNMNVEQCTDVVENWKTSLYDVYGVAPYAFVWDDGWDEYGTWTFNKNFPNGFSEPDAAAREQGAGIGAWLGPVGGYGTSGTYRRSYWEDKGGMQLSNPDYYQVFLDACTRMIEDYDFRFFKFDGISAQFSAVGPDDGTEGEENAEAIINIEREVRKLKPDIFINTTVGTWASPFWYQFTDATWRQENDYGEIGDQGTDREKWITYRDRLVYQNYVQNSPLCPINTLMTHGFILSNYGSVSTDMTYSGVRNELRAAFACGSGMVELYCDYSLMNSISNGKLWSDLADCIAWQEENADVLPDIHWIGGNPWDGTNANVYGWGAWNGERATFALRNPAASSQKFTFTLREALEIPDYVTGDMLMKKAFTQSSLSGMPTTTTNTERPIGLDEEVTVTLAASSLYVFNGTQLDENGTAVGIQDVAQESTASAVASDDTRAWTLQGTPATGDGQRLVIRGGKKVINN